MSSLFYKSLEHYKKHSENGLQFFYAEFFYQELEQYTKIFSSLASISE